MAFIYLASPYNDEDWKIRRDRYERVSNELAVLLKSGEIVFSPIVHCHPLARTHELPKDAAFWRKQKKSPGPMRRVYRMK